jgi:hypothetical protein
MICQKIISVFFIAMYWQKQNSLLQEFGIYPRNRGFLVGGILTIF